MKLLRRKFLHLAAGAAAVPVASRMASGQTYPAHPMRFIVPYPPGGATDVAARVISEYLSRSLGQQIVVENKSGGGSLIGVESAAKSTPDGYTVLVTTDIVTSAPHIFKMSIDPLKALAPAMFSWDARAHWAFENGRTDVLAYCGIVLPPDYFEP